MRRLIKTILPLAALIVVAAGNAAADVTIFRGTATQVVVTGQPDGAPTVLRGGGSVILPVAAPAADRPRAGSLQITAGRTLWLVDRERRRITACALRDTGTIDRRRIRCTRY